MKDLISFQSEQDCINFIQQRRKSVLRGADGVNDFLSINGYTHQLVKDKDGFIKTDRWVPNLVTTVGKALVTALMVDDIAGTEVDYMAIGIGTSSAVAGDTTLGSEITTNGGQRVATTGTQATTTTTNDTAQWVASWTFTGTFAVTEAGLLNASSSGTLLARQVFPAINVVSGDSLQITWKIALS